MRFSAEELMELDPPAPSPDLRLLDGTGDPLTINPLDNNIRICTINVNGIRCRGKNSEENITATRIHTEIILNQARESNINFLTITEPNIDMTKAPVREAVRKGAKTIDRYSKLAFATSSVRAENVYKPGGIISIGFNEFCGRIIKSEYDSSGLGRWTITMVQGNKDRCLSIVSVYVPITSTANSQTSVAAQQSAILVASGKHDDPTIKMWNDLNNLIHSLKEAEHDIIIMGDLNASIFDDGRNDKTLAELCISFELVDAVDERYPQTSSAPTWRQGRRIDYILCSRSIAEGITKSGISPLGAPFASDHRAVFCDIDFEAIYGVPSQRITRSSDRILNPRNIGQVGKFLEEMDKRMEAQQIHQRCSKALNIMSSNGPFDVASKLARKADADLRKIMLESERKCGKPYTAPWSKKLHSAAQAYAFWTWVRLKYKQPLDHKFIAAGTRLGINISQDISKTEVKKLRRESEEKLFDIRRNAASERQSMLEDDLATAIEKGDKTGAKRLRKIINAEATRESYEKLKRIKKGKSSGLTAVQTIDENGNIRTTTHPPEMNDLLIAEGRRHFAQAEGTPFTVTPLADIEYTADCIRSRAILDGCSTFAADDKLDEFTQNWIKHAKRMNFDGIDKMSVHLTREDVKAGYSAWKISTTTSPAGDHLGIYAALNKDLSEFEDELPQKIAKRWKDIQNNIWDSVTAIMNMGASFGLTLPRWHDAVCVLIEKAPGNFLLNKLRRIFILPSDLNLALREIVGRRLIYRAEANNWLHKDLWGNRPNRSATDAILTKEIIYSTTRLTNTAMATFDNDAKSCYDRIVIKVALILAQRLGLPQKTARWIAQTTASMRKWVQTGYGVTDQFWGADDGAGTPQHGSVQGGTDSGAKWLIDSSFLAERMDIDAKGAYFCSPDQKLEHDLRLLGFVDDVTQFLNFFREYINGVTPSIDEIAKFMQSEAETWRKHVRMTGGELELPKCFWYMFYPDVDRMNRPRETQLTALQAARADISIENEKGVVNIELKGPDQAHKTLGVYKTISGNHAKQIEISRAKSEHLAHLIARANLNQRQARMAHEAIVIPSLVYPLAASTLTWEEAKMIHSPALNACLSKLILPRSIGRHQVHSSRDYGGLQLSSLAGMQAWAQIEVFQTMIRRNDEASNLARIGLAWAQLVAGTEDPILSAPDQRLLHLPKSIFTALRDNLSSHGARLDIHNAPSYPTLRKKDAHIMEIARRATSSKTELVDINLCRLFLGAVTIADIATPDGRRIERAAFLCATRNFRRSRLIWPNIKTPSTSQLECWRRFVVRNLLKTPPHHSEEGNEIAGRADRQDMQLITALGQWTAPPLTRQIFDELSGPAGILKWINGAYTGLASPTGPDDVPFEYTPRADYDGRSHNRHDLPTINRNVYTPAMDRFRPSDPTAPTQDQQWSRQQEEIQTAIADLETILVATDGSTDGIFGGFGVTIATDSGKIIADSWGPATGHDHTSFRTEAAAMKVATEFIVKYEGSTKGKFHIISDSQSLVKLVNKVLKYDKPSLPRNQDEYDLVWPTILLLWKLKKRVVITWVEAHQDTRYPDKPLSIPARLNIHTDHIANKGTRLRIVPTTTPTEQSPIQLFIDDKPITRRQRMAILQRTYKNLRRAALRESLQLGNKELDQIDWKGLGATIASLSHNKQITASRIVSNNLPLGKQLLRSCKHENHGCDSCGSPETETIAHMICCEGHVEWKRETIKKIHRLAETDAWSPTITGMIIRRISSPLTAPAADDLWPWLRGIHLWRGATPTDLFDNAIVASAHPKPDKYATRRLTHLLFERLIDLWEIRNGYRHGRTPEERQTKKVLKLRARAALLCEAGIVPPKNLTVPTADQIKEMKQSQLRSFIRWADVILALQERPPPEPDPNMIANYNAYCPGHSRTPSATGASRKRHFEDLD